MENKDKLEARYILPLKDLQKGEIRGTLCEWFFDLGVIIKEMHAEHFFENCSYNQVYRIYDESDITLIFEEGRDKDYPIVCKYKTIYNDKEITIDYYSKEIFEKEVLSNV